VTWRSDTGQALLYDNGRLVWEVVRGRGKRIPSGGTLVIGREQGTLCCTLVHVTWNCWVLLDAVHCSTCATVAQHPCNQHVAKVLTSIKCHTGACRLSRRLL
jgi:hypothetical protein